MSKNLKKNSFLEGAFISYLAIVATKILGAFYNIPFYRIIGDKGSVIYSFAYNIYALFLDISTSGIPVAISIVISEYSVMGMLKTKEKAYKIGLKFVVAASLFGFVCLQLFAPQIATYYLAGMEDGISLSELIPAIRSISLCLLIVPFLSMKRGYLQGHKCIAASSESQVTEQIVRIGVVLAGSYVTIYIMGLNVSTGVCVALLGAALGALVAYIQLALAQKKSPEIFYVDMSREEEVPTTGQICKKIFSYCIVLIIVSVSNSVYNLVTQKLLLTGLRNINMPDATVQHISSLASTWVPKICMIVTALALGMTNSIAPHMAENYTSGNFKKLNEEINQALGIIILIAVPIATGMIIFSDSVFAIFYGANEYGSNILKLCLVLNVIGSMVTVINMAMHSMGKGKFVCVITLVGIVLNICICLPLIYFYNNIGIAPYLGATTASIVGQVFSLVCLIFKLKNISNYKLTATFKIAVKTLIPLSIMVVLAIVLKGIISFPNRTLFILAKLSIVGIVCAVVYFFIAYKIGLLKEAMGQEMLDGILGKLHLKK